MPTVKKLLSWTGIFIIAVFFWLITFNSFNEWWIVKVIEDTEAYPWGAISDNPWYYRHPDLYSTVMLAQGISMLIPLTILTRYIIKRQKNKAVYPIVGCFVIFIAIIINGLIS